MFNIYILNIYNVRTQLWMDNKLSKLFSILGVGCTVQVCWL